MTRTGNPLDIVMYQDVLCARCHIASHRIEILQSEFGETLRWAIRPFPVRPDDKVPTPDQIQRYVSEIRMANREFKESNIVPDLWTGADPPRSTVPALVALEAARSQGNNAFEKMFGAMRRAAFEQGLNITRSDIVFELACRLGLDMNRFEAVCKSPETRRWIVEEARLASERGVERAPTLVIGDRWMLSGLRSLREYRQRILECLRQSRVGNSGQSTRLLH